VTLPFLDTDDIRIRRDFRHERFDQSTTIHTHHRDERVSRGQRECQRRG